MLTSKPVLSPSSPASSHQADLRLPNVSRRARRRRFRSSPTPSHTSGASTATNMSENVSALKAKYTDYAMWLRAASRRNREPVFTHELLKHSLCEMGIDSVQAEQLVSTCTWYVYQFQKELGAETDRHEQLPIPEQKKQPAQSTMKKRTKKTRTTKVKKSHTQRELSAESTTTINSNNKENHLSSGPSSPTRQRYPVLPAIHPTGPSISPRSRRVDFGQDDQPSSQLTPPPKSSQWRSAMTKVRVLPKLRSSETNSSITTGTDYPLESPLPPTEIDLSSSYRSSHRPAAGQTRSILRKQISSSSSVASPDIAHRLYRNPLITPASTIVDEIPLGTRSQRLFGGSECFAQIMNELEEQTPY